MQSIWNRWRWDLAAELTTGACAAVILGLFFYIFRDFLGDQLPTLSPNMAAVFTEVFTDLVALCMGIVAGHGLLLWSLSPDNLLYFASQRGEDMQRVKRTRILILSMSGLGLGLCGVCILAKMFAPSQAQMMWTLLSNAIGFGMGAFAAHLRMRSPAASNQQNGNHLKPFFLRSSSIALTIASWRLPSLVWLRPTGRFFFLSALFVTCCGGFLAGIGSPPAAQILLAFAAGFIGACALPLQIAEDLNHAWIERSAAVSHGDYEKGVFILAAFLGFVFALVNLATSLLATIGQAPSQGLIFWLQTAAIAATPALVAPALAFQIDPRRASITILIVFLVGLFVGTAIFAHIASAVLVPLIMVYGSHYQKGRFHRA